MEAPKTTEGKDVMQQVALHSELEMLHNLEVSYLCMLQRHACPTASTGLLVPKPPPTSTCSDHPQQP